jgi:polysaccharide pyruvyl transferase WcaK-like protein
MVLVHPQTEYRGKARHEMANAALQRLVESREMSAVPIDTRLDENSTGLRTPAEVESLIARMDIVLTTRLHGTVLALKNGVPAIAIDPIAGGAKILRQAETIGWPVVFTADKVTDEALQKAFDYCLTEAARIKAQECCERARKNLAEVQETLLKDILNR